MPNRLRYNRSVKQGWGCPRKGSWRMPRAMKIARETNFCRPQGGAADHQSCRNNWFYHRSPLFHTRETRIRPQNNCYGKVSWSNRWNKYLSSWPFSKLPRACPFIEFFVVVGRSGHVLVVIMHVCVRKQNRMLIIMTHYFFSWCPGENPRITTHRIYYHGRTFVFTERVSL